MLFLKCFFYDLSSYQNKRIIELQNENELVKKFQTTGIYFK